MSKNIYFSMLEWGMAFPLNFFQGSFSFFNHLNISKHCKVTKDSKLHRTRHLTERHHSNILQTQNESPFPPAHKDLLPHLLPQSVRECAVHQKQMSIRTKQFEYFFISSPSRFSLQCGSFKNCPNVM